MILSVNMDYFLKHVNKLIAVMAKCGVLFEIRVEFLTTIYTSVGFKGLM
jgi:hypothetical protein